MLYRQVKHILPSLLRYAVAGISTFILDVGTLYTLHQLLGTGIALSTTIAYWFALFCNFLLMRFWAFEKRDRQKIQQHALFYGLLVAINYFVTLLFVSIVSHYVYFVLAKVIIVILQTCWNYPVYKCIVFRDEAISSRQPLP